MNIPKCLQKFWIILILLLGTNSCPLPSQYSGRWLSLFHTWAILAPLSVQSLWNESPKGGIPRVETWRLPGRLKQDLGIDTTPEIFKLPTERDWDMLSVWIWDYWCPQKGWTFSDDKECVRKLRWKDDVYKSNPIKDARSTDDTLLYTEFLHRVHSLCLAMAQRREEGRSAPSIALGSWEQAAMFQDASTQLTTSYFWNLYAARRLHCGRVFSLDLILLRL